MKGRPDLHQPKGQVVIKNINLKKVKYKKGLTFKKASFDTNLKPLKQK